MHARSFQTVSLDDEIEALTLQLQEFDYYADSHKGKYVADSPPDPEVALSVLRSEVTAQIDLLRDIRLAHSVADAVSSDGSLIVDMMRKDSQIQQDRCVALRLSNSNKDVVRAGSSKDLGPPTSSIPEQSPLVAKLLEDSTIVRFKHPQEERGDASSSKSYTEHQEEIYHKLSARALKCCACLSNFRPIEVVHLQCGDIYCVECLRSLFVRASNDLTLFPPRCCRQHIPLKLIESDLSADQLDDFQTTTIEHSTKDKVYCSNTGCGKFILPSQVVAGKAHCLRCDWSTCAMCKAAFHDGDCPADTDLQSTLALAQDQGWRRCFSCQAMVELNKGCFHITYVNMSVSWRRED